MTIDEHIGVIEDLKSTMSVCMPEPEKTEICTSLSKAIENMRKYQKIQSIVTKWYGDKSVNTAMAMLEIKEVMEDGKID